MYVVHKCFLLLFGLISIDLCSAEPAEGRAELNIAVLAWGKQRGVQCQSLRSDSTLSVPGLVAAKDISGNSAIVSLPRSLALSVFAGQPCPISHLVPGELWSNTQRHLQLALLLLTELKQGTKSKWHPYIAALPTSVHTLLHWTEEELKDLQYSTSEHEQHFLQEVKQQMDELQEVYWNLQSSPLVTQLNTTFDELVWASNMVRSRAFAIAKSEGWMSRKNIAAAAFAGNVLLRIPFFSQFHFTQQIIGVCRLMMFVCIGTVLAGTQSPSNMELALLPVIDSINHKSTSQGHLQPSRFGGSIEAYIGPDGATAGQEVTAAYATATNEVLLQHYGFVDTENTNDFYLADMVDFVKQTAVDQPNEENLQELAKRPILQKALTEAKLTPKGWQPETMQALRFLYASEDELRAAKSLSPVRWMTQLVQQQQLPTFGYFFDKPQSNLTETRVDQVLYSLCQDILQSKPTSLINDAAVLTRLQQSGSSTERQRLALQFRLAHKGLLQKCMLVHDVGGTT